jgi:corrinoid protein of di/trimethylamine methyltransferase
LDVDDLDKQQILIEISEAVTNFDADRAAELCRTAIVMGVPPYEIIVDGMAKGMDVVSKRYENGDYFLSELVMAGETMKQALEVVEPHLVKEGGKSRGTVVIGTVQGDLHDIGKHILGNLLRGAGFRVVDLGFDVSPASFADEVEKTKPEILGMSALITTTMTSMADTIEELKRRGLREKVKVIIGGAAVDVAYAAAIGADAAARDAVEGVSICKEWTK